MILSVISGGSGMGMLIKLDGVDGVGQWKEDLFSNPDFVRSDLSQITSCVNVDPHIIVLIGC